MIILFTALSTHSWAAEPVSATTEPEGTATSAAEKLELTYDLATLAATADHVILGEVVANQERSGKAGFSIVSVLVTETIRGEAAPMANFRIPMIEGSPSLVEGYKVLVFLQAGEAVGLGRGVFLIEAGHAWRRKDDGVFMSPRADRDWVDNVDPSADYTVYSLDQVRAAIAGDGK